MSASNVGRHDRVNSKRLLRFGTDRPRCAKCNARDLATLCRVRFNGKSPGLILCGNCKAEQKQLSTKAARQKAKRFETVGYREPACIVCDNSSLGLLERDHLAGAANSELIEPLCANHHAIKSHLAESGPMADLRLRDLDRSKLALQAAFQLGLAAVLGMMAAVEGTEDASRAIFFGAMAVALIAWAMWNLAADSHFQTVLGPGYDRAIIAEVPR